MGLTLHLLELGVVGGEEKVDALRLPVTVDVQLEIGQRGAGGGKIHDLENDVPQEEHVDTQMKSTLNVHNAALHRERERVTYGVQGLQPGWLSLPWQHSHAPPE